MLEVTKLRCEYLTNPLGLGEPHPRFSWVLQADSSNVMQKSYRVQVGANRGFVPLLWDTEAISSSSSIQVEYAGPALCSCSRYFWRVKIADTAGQESPWSDPSWFETAILDRSLWKARFISSDDDAGSSRGMRFRGEASVDGEIAWARLYATALGIYEISLNGANLGDAVLMPGWTAYEKRLLYQTFDVTELLRPGANVIGATVAPGWYKGDLAGWLGARNLYGTSTALFAQLIVRLKNGGELVVSTDAGWKVSEGPVLMAELYHGESYDARLEEPGWDAPGFDDSPWRRVAVLDRGWDTLAAQDGPPVRRQETLSVKTLTTTPKGERVLDFGQNLAGWVRFTVRGNAGDRVVLRHAEILDAEGNFYTANLRGAKARIEYTLRGGAEEVFEPHFTSMGFRYVCIDEYPGTPRPENFSAVVVSSDMGSTGSFECSHPLLNALHRNIDWSLKGNFIDVPTDCPQRDERLGWTGDAQVFVRTASFHRDIASFMTKWLRDLAADQRPDGGVPFVIPDVLSKVPNNDPHTAQSHSSSGWGDAAVICPWTLYEVYGDRRILERQYESMKGWVEYVRGRAQDGLLWNTGYHFGDWVALDAKEGSYFGATPNDLIATAFYAYSSELLARTAAALSRATDADKYRRLHEEIVRAFRAEFFTLTGRLASRTQTAHILALSFGLVPPEHRGRCVETLVELLKENGGHLTTGFIGTPYFCRALSDNGRLDEAYTLLLKEDYPSWLYQITRGATTIWEHWDGIKPDGSLWSVNMNSFNHYAYGSVGDWLYRVVGGLDAEEPGYKKIRFEPRPGGGLTWARVKYTTPYGPASLEWRLEGGDLRIEALVPHNTTARLILPHDGSVVALGSGFHTFRHPYAKG